MKQGGLAGSVGQLVQRIGTAVGTAVALSLFYSTVNRLGGGSTPRIDVYHDAYALGMVSVGLFLALALVLGVADLSSRRRRARQA